MKLFIIGIKIQRDKSQGILQLSQDTYINKGLKRFQIKYFTPSMAPIINSDKLNFGQCPKNDFENEQIKNIPYASAIETLMYVFTRPRVTLDWNTG